ncbi:MAG: M10 family metallopeptidase C-terminal domain-containing protein [Reyranellaceae bacterium]
MPSGAEPQVAFISGVTDAQKLATTSFATWRRNTPATFEPSVAREMKWGSAAIGSSGGTVAYWFDGAAQWTAAEQGAIGASLALWSALADVSFTLAPSEQAANQVFFRAADARQTYQKPIVFTTSAAGSDLAGQITKSEIHIDTNQPYWHVGTSFDDAGGYGWQTVVHEIGHMLGLGHAGPYNGNVDVTKQQFGAYDTRAWTLMSYIDPTNAKAKFFDDYPVTADWGIASTDGGLSGYRYGPTTPMVLDILAIQRLYGAATSGPLAAGGQVFGFNSNIEGPAKRFFDFSDNRNPVITIWDGGANNTLDLSGFSKKSVVDLNPGKFSSANGKINNIAIAIGTTVESVVTGDGSDTLTGSAADNTFKGNRGDDTIDGGAGTDTAIFSGLRSAYTLTDLGSKGVRVTGPDGSDTLANVERLRFDDGVVDWPAIIRDYADSLDDRSNAFGLAPVGETVGGALETAADRDWFAARLVAGVVYTIDLAGLQGGAGTLANPLLRLHDNAGVIVAENDDISGGSNPDSRITYVVMETGTYYIEAGAFGDNLTGTFELTIGSLAVGADDFADNLGDPRRPLGALSAGRSSTGTLEVATDRDWFAVQLVAGARYSLDVVGAQGGGGTLEDPYLRLRDGDGLVIGVGDDSRDGTSTDSQLVFEPAASGTYYLEAGSYLDSGEGSYTVSVSTATNADDLAGAPAEDFRPVGQLSVGRTASGTIEDWGDRDWFVIQATAGDRYDIAVTGAKAGADVLPEPYLILHDSAGRTLAESGDDVSDANAEAGLSFVTTEGGLYYVEVASFLDLFTGTYAVELSESTLIDDAITALYTGYCDRAPDAAGAAYWLDQLEAGRTLAEISRSFSAQPEPGTLYGFLATPTVGDAAADFLVAVYGNLFGRTPDAAGAAYWIGQLTSGTTGVATAILDILSGAQAGDALVIANKVAVGNYYVAQTFNHHVSMTPASARQALDGIDYSAASARAAQAEIDTFIAAVEQARLFSESVPTLGVQTIDNAI